MWLICYILTAAGALPDNKGEYGYEARTDLRLEVIDEVAWVRFPYPGTCSYLSFVIVHDLLNNDQVDE